MKRLGSRWMAWAILFWGLSPFVCPYPASGQELSFEEAYQQAKTDWVVELPHSKGYFYTCDDGFVFSAQDRTGVYRYNAQGVELWAKADAQSSGISQNGRFALIQTPDENRHERYPGFYYEYLDAEGNVLWRSHRGYDEGPYLGKISTTGKYLINQENAMNGRDVLTVVDGKTGAVLWEREGEMSPWEAGFAGEERIVYYHHVTLHLLDSATGEVIWERDLRPFLSTGFGGVNTRRLFVSDDGARIAVSMNGTAGDYEKNVLVLFDGNGEVLWTLQDDHALRHPSQGVFSTRANLLLVKSGSRWVLIDTSKGQKLWEIEKKVSGHFTIGERSVLVEDGAIYKWSRYWGTAVLELDHSFHVSRYTHLAGEVLVFPEKDHPGLKNALSIVTGPNGYRISKRTVNLGREGQ